MPGSHGGADPLRGSLDAARLWSRSVLGARETLARAAWRSGEEARNVRESARGTTDPVFLARAGDLARSQWSLWAWAALAAGERLGRASAGAAPSGFAPFLTPRLPSGLSPRTMVIGTVAAELYTGYAALRERHRWFPGLVREEDWGLQHRRGAGRLLDTAEALGGTLIKGGQFASTRPDLLPTAYTETLSSLQDRVPPQPPEIVEGAIESEIGRPVAEVFPEFDREPVAAASIAQVHRARLGDGREVAVKVQYPGIAGLVDADLDALEAIFEAIARLEPDIRLQPIADYLRWTLPLELDFRREARSIADLRDALSDREDVIIPETVGELTTGRLLVMEYVEGAKVTDLGTLEAAGMDPREVAALLNDAYADQLFRRGVLHADPHPGNLFVQPGPDGPRLVVLDHGLTISLEPDFTAALGRMVGALRNGDLDGLIGALGEAGLPIDESTDLDALLRVVGVLLGGEREGMRSEFGDFGRRLGASVGDIPPRLLLVGRAIGLVDGITRRLDPDLDALEIVARYTDEP